MRWLGRAVFLIALAAGGYALYRWGPELAPAVRSWMGRRPESVAPVASPELARATLERVDSLRQGGGPERLALGEAEVASVLLYALGGRIPEGVTSPNVALSDSLVNLSGRVAVNAFDALAELDAAVGFLPDTLALELEGALVPFDGRHVAFVVHGAQAAGFPLPEPVIVGILDALGREASDGAPPNVLVVSLPRGLESAYIRRDSLILTAER